MATTDTSIAPTEELHVSDTATSGAPAPIVSLFGTGDHKIMGRLFMSCGMVFGLLSLALLAATAVSQNRTITFVKSEWVSQISSLSRVGLVFFFLIPLFLGLAIYIVPLQVGAATIAFPRAVAASFWTWLVSSGMAIVAWMANGGPAGGSTKMVDLSLFATGVAVLALLITSICVATTVVTFRTAGMGLDRVPFFSWSMVVVAGVWVLTLPVLLGQLILIYIDHHYGVDGGGQFGKAAAQWQIVSWAFSAPQVFAYAIPALGITADAVSTLGKARMPQRGIVLTALGAFGALSFGAWVQPAFYPKVYNNWTFVVWSVALVVPVLLFLGGIGGVMRKGKPSVAAPVIGGLAATIGLLLGALGAALFAIRPLKLHEAANEYSSTIQDLQIGHWYQPAAQVGVFGIVVLSAAIGGVAGLAYWGAKITGKPFPNGAASLAVPLMLLGAVLYGAPLVGIVRVTDESMVNTLSLVSAAGAVLALLGLVVVSLALIGSMAGKGEAANDPWNVGQTLEWDTTSPPERGNFATIPVVTSPEPLLDRNNGEPS